MTARVHAYDTDARTLCGRYVAVFGGVEVSLRCHAASWDSLVTCKRCRANPAFVRLMVAATRPDEGDS